MFLVAVADNWSFAVDALYISVIFLFGYWCGVDNFLRIAHWFPVRDEDVEVHPAQIQASWIGRNKGNMKGVVFPYHQSCDSSVVECGEEFLGSCHECVVTSAMYNDVTLCPSCEADSEDSSVVCPGCGSQLDDDGYCEGADCGHHFTEFESEAA